VGPKSGRDYIIHRALPQHELNITAQDHITGFKARIESQERRVSKIKRSGRIKSQGSAWYLLLVGVALVTGISLIGPAMALWYDGLTIWEQVNTGKLTGEVLFTKVFAEDKTLPPGEGWGAISTQIEDEDGKEDHQIIIDIDRENNKRNWTLNSKIENRGSIPVRFLEPVVTADEALEVAYDLPSKVTEPGKKGLDPEEAVEGQIRIDLKTDVPGTYTFQIDVKCIQWNAYNEDPDWWNDILHIYGTVVVE
jgi:hypothetical protein